MESLPHDLIGCVNRDAYTVVRNPSSTRLPALRGRARYRLKDTNASYTVDLTMAMSDAQFNLWQTFWAGPARHGDAEFGMMLSLSDGVYEYPVRIIGPWQGSLSTTGRWEVSMVAEVPAYIAFRITFCDVIYGGPISGFAADSVYGGPISNLATDVIEPCDAVFGGLNG